MSVLTLERPRLEGLDGSPSVAVLAALPATSQIRLAVSPVAGNDDDDEPRCKTCGSGAVNRCPKCGAGYCNCPIVKEYHTSGQCKR